MSDIEQKVADLRARIAALRSRLEHGLNNQSLIDNSPTEETPMIETSAYDQMKGADEFISDQSAIDEKKAKAADLDALRAKLRGK